MTVELETLESNVSMNLSLICMNVSVSSQRIQGLQSTLKSLQTLGDLSKDDLNDILLKLISLNTRYYDSQTTNLVSMILQTLFQQSLVNASNLLESRFILLFLKSIQKNFMRKFDVSSHISLVKILNTFLDWILNFEKENSTLESGFVTSSAFHIFFDCFVKHLDIIALTESHFAQLMFKRISGKISNVIKRNGAAKALMKCILRNDVIEGKEGTRHALLLGICSNAIDELAQLESFKQDVITYSVKAVLMSKTAIPTVHLSSLQRLVNEWMTLEIFTSDFKAPSEKLFLRSPEVTLVTLNKLFSVSAFETGSLLSDTYADLLLNQLKSTNESIRKDGYDLFVTLIRKVGYSDVASLIKVVEIIKKAFTTKSPSPDAKILYYTLFSEFSPSPQVSTLVCEILMTFAAKESNETVLTTCLTSWAVHVNFLLSSTGSAVDKAHVAFLIVSGLKQAKSSLKRPYLHALNMIPNIKDIDEDHIISIVSALTSYFETMPSLPSQYADSSKDAPKFMEAYLIVLILLQLRLQDSVEMKRFLAPSSVILSDKLYTKFLTEENEQIIFAQTIKTILLDETLFALLLSHEASFSKLLSWSCLKLGHASRRIICETWTKISTMDNSLRAQQLFKVCLSGMVQYVDESEVLPTAESLAWTVDPVRSSSDVAERVLTALQALLPKISLSWVEDALKHLLVFCNFPCVTRVHQNDFWIRLCIRSKFDPANLIKKFAKELVDTWCSRIVENRDLSLVGGFFHASPVHHVATLATLRLMTEVCPAVMYPLIVPWTQTCLFNPDAVNVTTKDILIWKTEDGVLFDDPLSKQSSNVNVHNLSADERWELELLKEIAAKKGKSSGGTQKFSKAEKDQRDQQLEEERAIRKYVAYIAESISVALKCLDFLLDGVSEKYGTAGFDTLSHSYVSILECILSVIEREQQKDGCGALAGMRAIELYKKLVNLILGHASQTQEPCLVSALVLKAMDLKKGLILPKYENMAFEKLFLEFLEPLNDRFSSSNLIPAQEFTILLPMLETIVFKRGVCFEMKEKAHISLVIAIADLVIMHASLDGPYYLVPRRRMLAVLLRLMDRYPNLRGSAQGAFLALSVAATSALEASSEEDEDSEEYELAESTTRDIVHDVIHALLHPEVAIRTSALDALVHMPLFDDIRSMFDIQVWMSTFDTDFLLSEKARSLWIDVHENDVFRRELVIDLVRYTVHKEQHLRSNASTALGKTLVHYPDLVDQILQNLFALFAEKAREPTPEYDQYGVIIKESLNKEDEWRARAGIANALTACVPVLQTQDRVMSLLKFLIDDEALGDRNSFTRRQLLDSGMTSIKQYGSQYTESMLNHLQTYLEHPPKASKIHDQIRESVVLLFGTLAQHLPPTDSRIKQVVDNLLGTLSTPSEVVQVAVSECLPPLIKICRDQTDALIDRLLTQLFESEKYGDRRGAAYGLSGVVKGYGIGALKEFAVMESLREAVEDKKRVQRREGALFAFETLSLSLGRLFEPYVIQILPHLLVCFGDANKQIRNATEDTCRVIMSKLSAHCVKLLLPSLLRGLEEKAWRTQIGSIEVMASMSSLAPKQLSQSLPTIVPRLCEALADSHQKVQDAAKQALVQFGSVIKNPEIQALVPTLISALVDPNKKTETALSQLLETTFIHYIDAPSMALLMPIVHRGLRERSAEIKRKGAQIMGNMASLTDKSDLLPYLPSFVPSLKEVLVDPVPEARATAAHAFGTMVKTLGEDNFPDLVAELLKTLKSDTSGVDRSGAAQGLSEVLAGLGTSRLHGLMPEILANISSPKSYVREGFMTLLIYLPATFGDDFADHLESVIDPILMGLADDSESVRDAAFRAGQVVIRKYASTSVTIFLPSLEKGLFDENWRIRQSSVQLLGDLLFRIAGVSSKVDTDDTGDDEGLGTEQGRQTLKSALGLERYEAILAALYIVRADSHAVVRQASLHVWKAIVTNTPKTLKEVMSVVMRMVVESLASSSLEKQGVAARTLGELVRKMGDVILHEVMPIFEKGLDSDDAAIREGVCLGMSEIMNAGGKTHILDYISQYAALIRKALINNESTVREAAAQAFDILHQHIGAKAVDEVVPPLLRGLLSSSDDGFELEGLRELMAVRSHVIFPVLIPSLISVPMSSANAQALSSLIPVAGPALVKKISLILPALMDSMEASADSATDVQKCAVVLLSSVNSSEGVHQVLTFLAEMIQEGTTLRKQRACEMLTTFFANTTENIDAYTSDWLCTLIGMLSGVDGTDVMKSAWSALDALVKRSRKEELDRYVSDTRKGMKEAEFGLMPSEDVPGYNLVPKSIEPMLSIFLQGLMFGSSDVREQSAQGIGELVSRTSTAYLKPFVTQITGSLIRVVGDRVSIPTKVAILHTIGLLLTRVPALIKPFLPQMQRIFVKSLADAGSTPSLRDRSSQCLTLLIPLQPRLDPLVVELTNGLKTAEEAKVKAGIWDAIYSLLKGLAKDTTGKSINEANRANIDSLIKYVVHRGGESDVEERISASKCYGALLAFMDETKARATISTLLSSQTSEWGHLHGVLLCLVSVGTSVPSVFGESGLLDQSIAFAVESLKNEKALVVESSVQLLSSLLFVPNTDHGKIVASLVEASKPGVGSTDARRDALSAIKALAKADHTIIAPYLSTVVPTLMTCVRDRTIPVKLAAERALIYTLQIKLGDKTLDKNLKTLDASTAKTIGDYARRVLTKTSAKDSDDEDDEEVFS